RGRGHSLLSGPSPGVTDNTGRVRFTVTDQTPETVTYTAVDATDGVPVPGNAQVTFSGSAGTGCVAGLTPPTGANGNVVKVFASGFLAENFLFGNVNWGGCGGASNPTFRAGSVFIADFPAGILYKLSPAGGAVTDANVLGTLGPTLGQPTFGKDGPLSATLSAMPGNFTTGAIVQIHPSTGKVLRTVAAGLTCPAGLAVDPLSGDLFFDDACTGAGSDNPSIFRVRN